MSKRAVVCLAVTMLSAVAGSAQTNNWQQLMDRGQALEREGNYSGALAVFEEAARIGEQGGASDPRLVLAWNSVAAMHDALGHFPDSEHNYRRALAAAERSGGKNSPAYAVVLGSLGSLYIEMGKTARGESMLRESISIQEKVEPPNEQQLALARVCLAEALLANGRSQETERLLTAALAVWEKYPEAWQEHSTALNNLGLVELYRKRYGEAERLFLRALAIMETGFAPNHPMLVRMLNNLAFVYSRTGRREDAVKRLRRALDIVEQYLGSDHPANGILFRNYAALLRESGDKANARRFEARSAEVLKQSALRNGVGMVVDISELPRR